MLAGDDRVASLVGEVLDELQPLVGPDAAVGPGAGEVLTLRGAHGDQ
jgi:hypothetical protein